MFKSKQEIDKLGRPQVHFYLNQGDNCTIRSTPCKCDGEKVPVENVVKCMFKLSDYDYKQEFEKEMTLDNDNFVLNLTHEETANFAVDRHIYEIEYTLIGDVVNTPNQWYFDIVDQIIL